jgi:hypothetical protein
MGCCGSKPEETASSPRSPARETSAFTPAKLKLLRETLEPKKNKTQKRRGSACGRIAKALFATIVLAAIAFSGAAATGAFDAFCLGAAPLPPRRASWAPSVESRAEVSRLGRLGGQAFCVAVDKGGSAAATGHRVLRAGIDRLPTLPEGLTRRARGLDARLRAVLPAPALALWERVAGGPAPPAKAATPLRPALDREATEAFMMKPKKSP